MADVTPEFESAHHALRELCERFERGVEAARSLPSPAPHRLYELVGLAAECPDSLDRLRWARLSNRDRGERLVAAIIAECDKKASVLKDGCSRKIEQIKTEVSLYEGSAKTFDVGGVFSRVADVNAPVFLSCGNAEPVYDGGPAYPDALAAVRGLYERPPGNKQDRGEFRQAVSSGRVPILIGIGSALVSFILATSYSNSASAVSLIVCIVIGLFTVSMTQQIYANRWSHASSVLRQFAMAAISEFHEIKAALSNGLTELQAEREEKIDEVRSRTNRAMAYADHAGRSFDDRLCQCLDALQSLWDEWVARNTRVARSLRDVDGKYYEDERGYPCPRWTRLGMMIAGTAAAEGSDGLGEPSSAEFKGLRAAAEAGDAKAQFDLGKMYENGRSVPQDDVEAVIWFRRAAEQGDADAQYSLGEMYMVGRGVPQDNAEVVAWFRRAAEQGNADAQNYLEHLGQGVDV